MPTEIGVSIDGKKVRAGGQTPVTKKPVDWLTRTNRLAGQLREPAQCKTKWSPLVPAARQALIAYDQAQDLGFILLHGCYGRFLFAIIPWIPNSK
jgi:hypothetical protein